MAFQICPKCHNESFLWTSDGDPYEITTLYCHKCNYTALEDERNERVCAVCKIKSESLLKDKDLEYWWCFNCNAEHSS